MHYRKNYQDIMEFLNKIPTLEEGRLLKFEISSYKSPHSKWFEFSNYEDLVNFITYVKKGPLDNDLESSLKHELEELGINNSSLLYVRFFNKITYSKKIEELYSETNRLSKQLIQADKDLTLNDGFKSSHDVEEYYFIHQNLQIAIKQYYDLRQYFFLNRMKADDEYITGLWLEINEK